MKRYIKKEVTRTEKVLTEIICDECNTKIPEKAYYYEVTTGHRDWGNDSHESVEEFHTCSNECLLKQFNKYIENDSNTKYMEIEMEYNNIELT